MSAKLLTPADLAEVFGVSEGVVMEWRRTYKWPHVRVGRHFRWTPEQVEQITRTHTVKAGAVDKSGRTALSVARST